MNSYSHLLFRRGFLLTDIDRTLFSDQLTQQTIDSWNRTQIGKYQLLHDNELPNVKIESNGYTIVVLGLVLNPIGNENNIYTIAEKLLVNKQVSEEAFLNYLDELSGRFIVISQKTDITEIYNDACGTRTVYYDTKESRNVISSHSTIIADLLGYKKSKLSSDILTSKDFVGRKYLPGMLSPYDEITPLSPNTKYQVERREIKRIFPRSPLKTEVNVNELVEEITTIMKKQAKLLCEKHSISISLTAGLDSRLTYAAQKEIIGDVEYFTHINKNAPTPYEEDVKIANSLAELNNAPYKIYEYPADNSQDNLPDFKTVWEKNLGYKRGSMHLFKMYADRFPKGRVHVRSNIAEIARVFYKTRSETLNAKKLARLFSRSEIGQDPRVISSFKDFINTNKFSKSNFFNFEYQDLFYWEHRMPMWHSWIVNESDVAHETFVPYNNRILLTKMLSAPYEMRESGELFIRMIEKMWPDALQFPVNKEVVSPMVD